MTSIQEIEQVYEEHLKRFFGYDLLPQQLQAVQHVLNVRHTLTVLPTGFGKTTCFVLPPLLMDHLKPEEGKHYAIVISPLRSLIKKQTEELREKGLKAVGLLPLAEMNSTDIDGARNGEFQIILASPEAMVSAAWTQLCRSHHIRSNLTVLACDEAHCISQWGSDFRPKYKEALGQLRSLLKAPVLCCTATCTVQILEDILDCLTIRNKDLEIVAIVPDRPNIFLEFKSEKAMKIEDNLQWLVQELKEGLENTPKTIVYCRTMTQTNAVYRFLMTSLGNEVAYAGGDQTMENRIINIYHSSVGHAHEDYILQEFPKVDSKIRCLISTIAFGMGVDIRDIRNIIHWGVSKSILSYWQEVGRCSRDGQPGRAYLYATMMSLRDPERVEQSFIDVCSEIRKNEVECLRLSILKFLKLPKMDTTRLNELQERTTCDGKCEGECSCSMCICCSVCKVNCLCSTGTLAEKEPAST